MNAASELYMNAASELSEIQNSSLAAGERLRVHVIHADTSHDACTSDGGGGQSGMEPPRPSDGGGGYSTNRPSDGGGGQATDRQCMTATTFTPALGMDMSMNYMVKAWTRTRTRSRTRTRTRSWTRLRTTNDDDSGHGSAPVLVEHGVSDTVMDPNQFVGSVVDPNKFVGAAGDAPQPQITPLADENGTRTSSPYSVTLGEQACDSALHLIVSQLESSRNRVGVMS